MNAKQLGKELAQLKVAHKATIRTINDLLEDFDEKCREVNTLRCKTNLFNEMRLALEVAKIWLREVPVPALVLVQIDDVLYRAKKMEETA